MTVLQLFNCILVYIFLTIPDYISPWATATASTAPQPPPNTTQPCFYLGSGAVSGFISAACDMLNSFFFRQIHFLFAF